MNRIQAFIILLDKTHAMAVENDEEVFMSNDEDCDWDMYMADEEGYTPSIVIGVSPNGMLRLIDNSHAGPTEEPWRR